MLSDWTLVLEHDQKAGDIQQLEELYTKLALEKDPAKKKELDSEIASLLRADPNSIPDGMMDLTEGSASNPIRVGPPTVVQTQLKIYFKFNVLNEISQPMAPGERQQVIFKTFIQLFHFYIHFEVSNQLGKAPIVKFSTFFLTFKNFLA